jgi:tetratricopeptide (TPR) repeat protein
MSDIHSDYSAVEKLIDAEQWEEAAEGLRKIITQDDTFVLGQLAIARVYTKLGQYAEACRHGERACELEPNDPFNFTALSLTYQRAWAGTQEREYITKAEDAMAKAQMLHRG